MKYYYNIGTSSHEESTTISVWSYEKLSRPALFEKVKLAIHNYLDDVIKANDGETHLHQIGDIFYDMPSKYLEQQSLFPLKYQTSLSFWGWNSPDHMWELVSDRYDNILMKSIKDKMIKVNELYSKFNKIDEEEDEV